MILISLDEFKSVAWMAFLVCSNFYNHIRQLHIKIFNRISYIQNNNSNIRRVYVDLNDKSNFVI
jgi:hypothetical protein